MCFYSGYRVQLRIWDKDCRTSKEMKRWSDLESTARQWAAWSPSSAQPWLFLADAMQHQERYVEAAEYLGHVPKGTPQHIPSLLARCKLLFGAANLPFEGEQVCREILTINPRVSTAHELLIEFYVATMQRTKAREQIKMAIHLQREPRDSYALYFLIDSVRFNDGAPLNKLWLESYPDSELLLVAEVLQRDDTGSNVTSGSKSYTPAPINEKELAAKQLLLRFPQNVNLLAYLIEEELSRGKVERVIELLSESPADAETDQRFWRYKGWVHFANGELDQAENAYRHALSIHPMDWQTMHRLAEVLRLRGLSAEVTRLESLVKRSHDVRAQMRDFGTFKNIPTGLLRDIGQLARDCGDTLVGGALAKHLGTFDPERIDSPKHPK
jgi:tetratricopeptide (TPR) repeat protein